MVDFILYTNIQLTNEFCIGDFFFKSQFDLFFFFCKLEFSCVYAYTRRHTATTQSQLFLFSFQKHTKGSRFNGEKMPFRVYFQYEL